jgi:AcrR family transcriptional regulator
MATKNPDTQRAPVRERLLAAATELFYREGINKVGIDRIIERAGVAKASLYDSFGSKDELVRAYLEARHEARQARMKEKLARYSKPRDKLLGVFDAMGDMFDDPNFKGCAFVRASAEVAPDSTARGVCDTNRSWIRELFTGLVKEAGVKQVDRLVQQLVLLYDGASISAQMDGNVGAAAAARGVAASLLDAALPAAAKSKAAK